MIAETFDLHPASPIRRRVAICLWNDVELLDFAGPGEVFAAAADGQAFQLFTVAEKRGAVLSQGFLRLLPQFSVDTCPMANVIVVPGGGTEHPIRAARVLPWLATAAGQAEVVLSVCTGALVLAAAGLLEGLEATTWHGTGISRLRHAAPRTVVHEDRRFVDNGRIVTAAGVSAGIDAALHIVGRLCGPPVAAETARYMEYDWHPERYARQARRSG